jgi:acetyl-CoA carboxylase carboxyltransferase component
MDDELRRRIEATEDSGRPSAVERRRKTGQRTARENIADLLDEGSFVEYGGLALAAQRHARTVDELVERSPADGIVTGIGTVRGQRAMVLAYDYTVFAGTQGFVGHRKLDRMLDIAHDQRLPVVLYAEGGGGRPNDTDMHTVAGLETPSFLKLASLSGLVPRVGIASGRCFAGNAALLGSCDVVIADESSNIGMGGPVMIEGGGLGKFEPEEIGPIDVQARNGVVDIRVADEAEATAAARRYLGYFSGSDPDWSVADQAPLDDALPENRRRAYPIRPVVERLFDTGSVLELRRGFGRSIVTALARVEGRPVGVVANDTVRLAGAIDGDASDKMARFLQLCDAFGLPVVSLVDTPGFMVGPKAEETALVRRTSRIFVQAGRMNVPLIAVVLRRGYGLGAQAMTGGHFHAPLLTVSWPTGECGGMNLEGAVRLGMRKHLESIEDPQAREAAIQSFVEVARARGSAINMASLLEIDAVIRPADTRSHIVGALQSCGPIEPSHRVVDTW